MFREIVEEIGRGTLQTLSPILEFFAPIVPGNTFPLYFEIELFQSALIAAILSTIIAGLMGSFLLIRNLSLIGDGLAHVSFGGVAFAIVIGSAEDSLLWALLFSTIASILINIALFLATFAFKKAQRHYSAIFCLVYLQIVWSSLVGFYFFNEYLNKYALIGACFIVLSGIISVPGQIKQANDK